MIGRWHKSALIFFMLLLGAMASFGREVIFAALFGTNASIEAYRISVSLPQTVGMLLPGVFVASIMPVLQRIRVDNPSAEVPFIAELTGRILLIILLLGVVLSLFAPVWIQTLAPGLPTETRSIAAQQLRYLAWLLMPLSMGSIMKTVLDSRSTFWPGAANTLILQGTVCLLLFLLHSTAILREHASFGLVFSTLTGGLLLLIIYAVAGGWLNPSIVRGHIRRVFFRRAVYRVPWLAILSYFLYQGMGQTARFIDRGIASGLGAGSVSIVEYSFNLVSFPVFLLATSLLTVFYPSFTHLLALGENVKARFQVKQLALGMFVLSLPAGVLFFGMSEPLVALILQRGAFTEDITVRTAAFLSHQGYGMPFMTVGLLFAQVMMGYGKHRVLLMVGIAKIVVKIVTAVLFARWLGIVGLAVSFSVTAIFGAVISGILVFRVQVEGPEKEGGKPFIPVILNARPEVVKRKVKG